MLFFSGNFDYEKDVLKHQIKYAAGGTQTALNFCEDLQLKQPFVYHWNEKKRICMVRYAETLPT